MRNYTADYVGFKRKGTAALWNKICRDLGTDAGVHMHCNGSRNCQLLIANQYPRIRFVNRKNIMVALVGHMSRKYLLNLTYPAYSGSVCRRRVTFSPGHVQKNLRRRKHKKNRGPIGLILQERYIFCHWCNIRKAFQSYTCRTAAAFRVR